MAQGELKTIVRHGRIYGIANIVNRAAGFVLIPLYAHTLSPEQYGLFAIVTLVTDLASVLLGGGLGVGLVRIYLEQEDDEARDRVVSTAMLTMAGVGLAFAAIAWPAAAATSQLLYGTQEHRLLFTVAFVAMIFLVLFQVQLNYFRVTKQSARYLAVSVAKAILFIAANVYFVAIADMGVMGIVIGTAVSAAIIAIALTAIILRHTGMGFSRRQLRHIMHFGLPMVPSTLLDSATAATDKYVLNHVLGPAAVGPFALAEKLTGMLRMFVTAPFAQIWVVRRLESMTDQGTTRHNEFEGIFLVFHAVVTGCALGVALFAPEILAITASRAYVGGIALVPVMALTQVAIALTMHLEIGIHHAKKTTYLPMISVICLIVAVAMNLILVPRFGPLGAASATVATAVARAVAVAYLSNRVAPIVAHLHWKAWTTILILGVATAVSTIALIGHEIDALRILLKLGAVGLYAALAGLTLMKATGWRPRPGRRS